MNPNQDNCSSRRKKYVYAKEELKYAYVFLFYNLVALYNIPNNNKLELGNNIVAENEFVINKFDR